MRRGCVIMIIILSVIALVLSVLFWVFRWPKVQREETAKFAYLIEYALEQYESDQKAFPEGDDSQIVEVLYGDNPRKKQYMTGMKALIRDGLFTDYWKNPLKIELPPNGAPKVTSAGPNGEFGDADDVSSQPIRDLIK